MKTIPAILAICCATLSAQTPPPRPAPVISPEIAADGAVTFRIKAPGAKEVSASVQGLEAPLMLTKADDGLWSATAKSVAPGIWEYSFNVDGLTLLDPGNSAIKPMREPRTSILHIPSTPPAVWDFQDVPHGSVHQHGYLSKAVGVPREIRVYTPPGYETSAGKFPLLVLQHGSGDNQKTWVDHGKAHWILDSLIATGKAVPMIVLMLDGHPPGRDGDRAAAMDAFRRELLEDAMPLVEKIYRVEADRSRRGIVGLSMGGGQSLTVGLGNLDRFAWVGSFSGVAPDDAVSKAIFTDAASTNAKLRLLWIGCGKEDFLLKRNEDFIARLKENGIAHEWHLTDGGHSWPVWRGYLADFLPRLFQAAKD